MVRNVTRNITFALANVRQANGSSTSVSQHEIFQLLKSRPGYCIRHFQGVRLGNRTSRLVLSSVRHFVAMRLHSKYRYFLGGELRLVCFYDKIRNLGALLLHTL